MNHHRSRSRRNAYRAIIGLWIIVALVLPHFIPAKPQHWWEDVASWLFLLSWSVAIGWVYLSLVTAAKAGQPQAKRIL